MAADLFAKSDAVISPCGLYRYSLSRTWGDPRLVVCWIMLNPSTADASLDDPTIRRCVGFAKAWGAGGIHVVNLYAYRATSPDDCRRAADPVGPENNAHIAVGAFGRSCVAAWGAQPWSLGREREVLELLRKARVRPRCLGLTKDGRPRHPLYVPASAELLPYGEASP